MKKDQKVDDSQMKEIINKLPNHVFKGVDRDVFIKYLESVFEHIEDVSKIDTNAAISFLKMKFKMNDVNVYYDSVLIENQCRK